MGSTLATIVNLAKKKKTPSKFSGDCNCALWKSAKHCCLNECFIHIERCGEMVDLLETRWSFTAKHEKKLFTALAKYSAQHEFIVEIIKSFFLMPLQIATRTKKKQIQYNTDGAIDYHAYCHAYCSPVLHFETDDFPCQRFVASRMIVTAKKGQYSIPEYKMIVLGAGGVGKSALTIRFVTDNFLDEYDPTIEDSYLKTIRLNCNAYTADTGDTVNMDDHTLRTPHCRFVTAAEADGNRVPRCEFAVLDILDTAGREEYSAMRDAWIRRCDIALLCFSVTNRASFDETAVLRDYMIRGKADDDKPDGDAYHDNASYAMILVGCKNDLRQDQHSDNNIDTNPGNDGWTRKLNAGQHNYVTSEEALARAKEWEIPYIETSSLTRRNVNFLFRQCVYEHWIQTQASTYSFKQKNLLH